MGISHSQAHYKNQLGELYKALNLKLITISTYTSDNYALRVTLSKA